MQIAKLRYKCTLNKLVYLLKPPNENRTMFLKYYIAKDEQKIVIKPKMHQNTSKLINN